VTRILATCLLAAALLGSACAHRSVSQELTSAELDERVLHLEDEFARFTAVDLSVDDAGVPRAAEDAVAALERSVAELQRLRLRYLALVDRGADERQTTLILLRIAELHLDLAARGRRLPYPVEATEPEQRSFDARLGRIVSPLEAAGFGVLEQIARYHDDRGSLTTTVRRARLYLALHRDAAIDDQSAAQLRLELRGVGAFDAPRRLLEAGRLGRRASRR
jgi:hypothetical protein